MKKFIDIEDKTQKCLHKIFLLIEPQIYRI